MEFDFSKNEIVDTLEKVPEQFRNIYVEDPTDKKFKIDQNFKGITTAIDGLNGALRNERKSTSTLKNQKDINTVIKDTFGFDTIEDVKLKIEELNNIVTEKSKVDPAKIKADIEKTFNTKEEVYRNQLSKMQSTLDRYLVHSAGLAALNEQKGNAKLLMSIIKEQAVVVQDGDDFVVRIKDPAGDYRGNGSGGFMTVADLVKELKASADYGIAFQSDAPSGSRQQGYKSPQSRETTQRQIAVTTDGNKTPAQMISDGLAKRRNQR